MDLLDALDTLDSSQPLADLAAVFPNLRAARSASGSFSPSVDVGWNPLLLRLFARLNAAAALSGETIRICQVKEKFGTLCVYQDLADADRVLQAQCRTVVAEAAAESANRRQRCGAFGEMDQGGGYRAVLCADHRHRRTIATPGPAPTLSAHARLRLAARFGAEGWHEVQSPFTDPLLRARLVDDGIAFAVSLRGADPRDAARPQVVAAALCHDDDSVLHISGGAVMEREADLAARLAAEMEV